MFKEFQLSASYEGLVETVPDWTENLVEIVYFETVDDSFCFEHYFETLTMSVVVKLAVHVCTNSCLENDTDYPCNNDKH